MWELLPCHLPVASLECNLSYRAQFQEIAKSPTVSFLYPICFCTTPPPAQHLISLPCRQLQITRSAHFCIELLSSPLLVSPPWPPYAREFGQRSTDTWRKIFPRHCILAKVIRWSTSMIWFCGRFLAWAFTKIRSDCIFKVSVVNLH